jgi:predicted transcriptional regulator of viral defense system
MFPDIPQASLKQQLARMVKSGLLMRIKEGVYYIIPFEQKADCYMPDWHLLAAPLCCTAEHYIGYYSALQLHQLTTQPALTEQIVVNKQIKPSSLTLRSVRFQFIYHNPQHFFGYQKIWINNYDKAFCSDIEKTIIDCLYKPEYACGTTETAKAMYIAKDKIDFNKLLHYAVLFNVQAVIKRLGYLLELLGIGLNIVKSLHRMRTKSLTLLDTTLPKQGKIQTRWSIIQNADNETIISSILY